MRHYTRRGAEPRIKVTRRWRMKWHWVPPRGRNQSQREPADNSISSFSSYSGRKITPSLGYVTVRAEGKIKRARGSKTAKSLCMYRKTENIFYPFNFDTVGGILIHGLLYSLCFVNRRNYKTQAMQTHVLTRTRYFYSLNVIISYPIVYKQGLGLSLRMCYRFAVFPSQPRVYL
jgi:ribosomal protein L24E